MIGRVDNGERLAFEFPFLSAEAGVQREAGDVLRGAVVYDGDPRRLGEGLRKFTGTGTIGGEPYQIVSARRSPSVDSIILFHARPVPAA